MCPMCLSPTFLEYVKLTLIFLLHDFAETLQSGEVLSFICTICVFDLMCYFAEYLICSPSEDPQRSSLHVWQCLCFQFPVTGYWSLSYSSVTNRFSVNSNSNPIPSCGFKWITLMVIGYLLSIWLQSLLYCGGACPLCWFQWLGSYVSASTKEGTYYQFEFPATASSMESPQCVF